jgi:hypothetical protein
VDYVGHDRSSVAYSSGTLSDATRLTSLTSRTTTFLILLVLLEAPAHFLPLSFRECHTPEAGFSGTSLLGNSVNRGNRVASGMQGR